MPIVAEESPLQPEIASLLRQSDALAAELYPGEYRRAIVPETLSAPGITVFVARIEGLAAGCCVLLDGGDGTAELKRMIVAAHFRRRGVGALLLDAAEAAASARGIDAIRLEVGVRNGDGYALYRRAGYVERGPFGAYEPSPISRFLEKKLGQ